MSTVLSLLTCSTETESDDDFDFYDSPIAASLDGKKKGLKNLIKHRTTKRRRMSISGPTNFRHDVHLGHDLLVVDRTYRLWDENRWRLELAKKDLILPLPQAPATSETSENTSKTSLSSKRNSYTPQKRKPVPALYPDAPRLPSLDSSLAPHEIPLPQSPTITGILEDYDDQTTESEGSVASLPPLDPPSRNPSIDGSSSEDDELLAQTLSKRWKRPESLVPPSIKEEENPAPIHESPFQLQS